MKHLHDLYPPERIERKRDELDKLATTYVEKLFGFLPCLDLTYKSAQQTAENILDLVRYISKTQKEISGEATQPLQGNAAEAEAGKEELTEVERDEMVALIKQYGVVVMKDDASHIIYITHSTIQGRAMALNDRELYEIVQDIVSRVSAA